MGKKKKKIFIKIMKKNVHNYYSNLLSIFVVFSWKRNFCRCIYFVYSLSDFLTMFDIFYIPPTILYYSSIKRRYMSAPHKNRSISYIWHCILWKILYDIIFWQYAKRPWFNFKIIMLENCSVFILTLTMTFQYSISSDHFKNL